MNRTRALAGMVATLLALAAGSAAPAQLFKWVDERGVVNYSNQMPADPKTAAKVDGVEDRVSVYTPDAALVRDMEADRKARRTAAEQPIVYQPAVPALAATQALPAPVIVEPSIVEYPILAGFYRPSRFRQQGGVSQIKLPAGATAGAMLGTDLLIPGSTSPVPGVRTSAVTEPVRHRPRHSRWDKDR